MAPVAREDPLADQIEFDDERGLKFKKTPWTQAQWDEWNANLHPSLKLPTLLETPRSKSSGNKCPIPTAKGNRCSNNREPGRPACHIHDPESAYAKQYPKYRKKMIAELKRLGIA